MSVIDVLSILNIVSDLSSTFAFKISIPDVYYLKNYLIVKCKCSYFFFRRNVIIYLMYVVSLLKINYEKSCNKISIFILINKFFIFARRIQFFYIRFDFHFQLSLIYSKRI